ncbi:unnamed protein product [Closterium sp. NIES-64]|nr:unnamed protein product [Closterium sp. NIES-64]
MSPSATSDYILSCLDGDGLDGGGFVLNGAARGQTALELAQEVLGGSKYGGEVNLMLLLVPLPPVVPFPHFPALRQPGDGLDGGGFVLNGAAWGQTALELADAVPGDGLDGGGFVLNGAAWGQTALELAQAVLAGSKYGGEFELYGSPRVEDIDSFLLDFNALVIAAGERGELPKCTPASTISNARRMCFSPASLLCSYGSPMVEDIDSFLLDSTVFIAAGGKKEVLYGSPRVEDIDSFLLDFNALVITAGERGELPCCPCYSPSPPIFIAHCMYPSPILPSPLNAATYGSPMVEDIDSFLLDFNALVIAAGERGELPQDIQIEVSSPGAERVVKVPDDLIRFKELPMYVHYRLPSEADNTGDKSTTASGGKMSEEILSLVEVDEEERVTIWRVADVRLNRELYGGKGRPLSRKNRERRITVPFSDILVVRIYLDY